MNTYKGERKIGIIQILLSGFCFGFLGVFGKIAYGRGMAPGELLSLRFLLGGLILFTCLLVLRSQSLRLTFKEILICAGLGIFGYAVFSGCFFMALHGLSASLTVLLLYTYPLMVAAGAWIIFGEKIARDRWLALPLVLAGLVMLVWGDFQVLNSQALLFGVASAFFYSLYILASSYWLKNTDSLAAAAYIQLSAGIVLSLLQWRDSDRLYEVVLQNWLLLMGMAVIGSVLAMSLFLAGLKKLKNWETSVLSTAEPVTAIFLATVILAEAFSALQIMGALAVLGAFVLVAYPAKNS